MILFRLDVDNLILSGNKTITVEDTKVVIKLITLNKIVITARVLISKKISSLI